MEAFTITAMLFFVLFLLAAPTPASSDEAAALLTFKRSSVEADPLNSLKSWISTTTATPVPCSWAGVTCTAGSVTGLNLAGYGLQGRLRMDDLMALPNLQFINLHGNSFYGNLSYAASSPCSFLNVDLSGNNFTEAVAGNFLASCNNLVLLNLSRNSIPGGVYPYSPSLRQLDLSLNQISDAGLLNYSLSNCGNLNYLNFSGNKLAGALTTVSAACVNLRTLDLTSNLFTGSIPPGFMSGMPLSLKELSLSRNKFSGDFSTFDFGVCGNLTLLNLSSNALAGAGLPPSLANCKMLEWLDLSGNEFTDAIPSFWASFSYLKNLSLANNKFSGTIPPELGGLCRTLVELDLSTNFLTGGLPPAFTACSALQTLDLGTNQLYGDFIGTVVSAMPSLTNLLLPFNNITGPVPMQSLKNCTLLEVIDLSSNGFTGNFPTGFCSSHLSLQKILMPDNYLTGTLPQDLARCTSLQTIDLSFNELSGEIPPEIFALPKLVNLVMWANSFSGQLPDNLCSDATTLEVLVLNHNSLNGTIPASITKCTSLTWVALTGNRLTGTIPAGVGDLPNLAFLQLGQNMLSGGIPPTIGSSTYLAWLELEGNRLSGSIPLSIASQAGHVQPSKLNGEGWWFAFLRNDGGTSCPGASDVILEFNGMRPERLKSLPMMIDCPTLRVYTGSMTYPFSSNGSIIYIDLSNNSLSGPIPENIGNMAYTSVLNLGHNQLTGTIPPSFRNMGALALLDLSYNNLSGPIPGGLGALTLSDINLSNNNFSGQIPSGQLITFPASRFANNSGLCGIPLPPCGSAVAKQGSNSNPGGKRRLIGASVAVGIGISAVILIVLILVLYKVKCNQKAEEMRAGYVESLPTSGTGIWKVAGVLEPLSINVATFDKPLKKITFAHLLEATNGFSDDSCIGSGGFGEVYKAKLKDGNIVAIKKLVHATSQGDREFMAEMETIGKIKHRNLVPLLGYCKVGDERLLVYEYMKNGSLDNALMERNDKGVTKLDWASRKKIAIGSARGLAFLHHSCIPHIIHRDMKSSNVLIDENFDARVSDFGMARLMNAVDTHLSVSTLAGTPGYVPPEYYQSFRCTTKGDVYSYGVVLLELLSGKKPIDTVEFGDNNLVGWAKQLVKENRGKEIFDAELMSEFSDEVELYKYLKIAIDCLEDRPLRRPTMIQVLNYFKELQGNTDDSGDILDGLSVGGTVIDESRERTP